MKKITALLLAVILVSGLFVSCGIINPEEKESTLEETTTKPEETTKGTEKNNVPDVAVFDTENIQRITFYAYYGEGEGSDVPAENMAEIIAWLGTFTIDQKAPDIIAPGTNTWQVEIEYSDGTTVKEGLDVVSVDGVLYEVKSAKEPKCFENIISKTSLEEDDAPEGAVFNTKNISRITFYAYYGEGKGSDVPAENMAEIIAWLGTFTIDQKAPDIIAPGTNTWQVEIEYSDGTTVKEGLDVVSVDGVLYEVKSAKEPKCFENIISKTSLE